MTPAPDGRGRPPQQQGGGPPNSRRNQRLVLVLIVLGLLALNLWISSQALKPNPRVTIPYSPNFIHQVDDGNVESVSSTSLAVQGTFKHEISYQGSRTIYFSTQIPAFADGHALFTKLEQKGVTVGAENPNQGASVLTELLFGFGPTILLVLLFVFLMRRAAAAAGGGGGLMSFGRSRARRVEASEQPVTFQDVAGIDEAKEELHEIVDFLREPEKYLALGAKIPRGVLLSGPPGTGKTLLARAVAGEAGVPFFQMSASEFVEMIVGVGASRVRDLFAQAKAAAPAIIFVDELDAVGRSRAAAGPNIGGGHDEREQTLNQILTEMDGFDARTGVIVLGATNRPEVLDQALLRPGRFDRRVVVQPPDRVGREAILRVHTRSVPLASTVDLGQIASTTPGMVGADLANLVNEAALHAVRRGAKEISMEDFENARDRVVMGQQRDSVVLGPQERERVAFHEGGHALLAYVLHEADPLHKITIIPRGLALGVTMQLPAEDRHIYSREKLEDDLCVRMGGRVAELLVYGDLSTGAADDLVRNTELARRMVREWGMSKEIGPMAWGSQGQVFLGEDLIHTRDYSDETSKVIDDEVERILREQESRAIDLVTQHRRGLDAVAHALLEHETLDGETVGRLIDEAFGRPVYADGRKVGSSLRPATPPPEEPAPEQNGEAAPTGVAAGAGWAPPTIPGS